MTSSRPAAFGPIEVISNDRGDDPAAAQDELIEGQGWQIGGG